MSHHLAQSTSLYLSQHAENPVDWHPWGAPALLAGRPTAYVCKGFVCLRPLTSHEDLIPQLEPDQG